LPSIIKVDQIQSDTGTVNVSSNLQFSGSSSTMQVGKTLYLANTNNFALDFQADVSGRLRIASSLSTFGDNNPFIIERPSSVGGQNDAITIRAGGVVDLGKGQLKFPASQNASSDPNTLDDYEEGTWTPTITRASVSPSLTVSNSGRYVKIGRQVTVWGKITITAVASQGTNVWIIASLPFAQSGQRGAMGSASNFSATSISASTNVTEVGDSNVDNYFYCGNADGSVTNANFQAGTLHFTVTYES
jgi:hypothetical protein